MRLPKMRGACSVCGDRANGIYFGASVCLPCKSFFIRCTKDGHPSFKCTAKYACNIQNGNRMRCQACRFNKCLAVGMARREKPEMIQPEDGQELCRVCSDIANGLHFGVMTCEGCKKFFRRALKECATYSCKQGGECSLNPRSRNACRFCRHQKCVRVGMSREAIRMGRPKKIKRTTNRFRPHHDLRLSTNLASTPFAGFGPIATDPYSAPAACPATFGRWPSEPSYQRMLDCHMAAEWSGETPLSPVSSVPSTPNNSGQSSPVLSQCLQQQQHQQQQHQQQQHQQQQHQQQQQLQQQQHPSIPSPQDIKSEPSDSVWTDYRNAGPFQPCAPLQGSLGAPEFYSSENLTKGKPHPEISAVTNADVVDSLMQLASGTPRKASRLTEATGIGSLEEDAIDSLLRVLHDFESSDTPTEDGNILTEQVLHSLIVR